MNSEGLGICACEQVQTGKTDPKKCSREALGDGGRKVGNRWGWKGLEANAAGCVCSGCRRFPLIVLEAKA